MFGVVFPGTRDIGHDPKGNSMLRSSSSCTAFAAIAVALASGVSLHSAQGADLFVAGPTGSILRVNPLNGQFSFVGACGGPVQSMVQFGEQLLLGDSNGNVYELNLENDQVGYYFTLPGSNNTDMAVVGSNVLISNSAGIIRRVNPVNGQVLQTLTSPIAVNTIAVDGDFVYVAGPTGDVHRGNLTTGQFEYFACLCLSTVNSIAFVGEYLVASDHNGFTIRFNRSNGQVHDAFSIPGDNSEMVLRSDGQLFVSSSTGAVRVVNPDNHGSVTTTFQLPIAIQGMTLVGEDVPLCGADINADGVVNSVDFFLFIDHFLLGKPTADINRDGVYASDDFFAYLSMFFTNCA